MSQTELHPVAVKRAQDAFLKAIEDNCPEVLESLAGRPLDLYRELNLPDPENMMNVGMDPGTDHRLLLALFDLGVSAQPVAYDLQRYAGLELAKLTFDSLAEWARANNLPVSRWIISRAGLTVQWWVHRETSVNVSEKSAVGRRWFCYIASYETEDTEGHPPLEVRFAPFDSTRDSKADYRKWVLETVEVELDHYLKDKPEYWRYGKRNEEHFTWLALHLCKRTSITGLGKQFCRAPKSIREGIQTVAEVLKIELPQR